MAWLRSSLSDVIQLLRETKTSPPSLWPYQESGGGKQQQSHLRGEVLTLGQLELLGAILQPSPPHLLCGPHNASWADPWSDPSAADE